MKNQSGITLVSLIITIILIMILAAVGTYTGIQVFENMRVIAFVARMKTVQEAVDKFCENHTVQELNTMGSELPPEIENLFNTITGEWGETKESWYIDAGDNIAANYRYFSEDDIKNILGLKDFDTPIFFNPRSRNIISTSNVEYNGIKYYRQYDLPGGQSLPKRDFSTNFQLENVTVKTFDNKAVIYIETDKKISDLRYKKKKGEDNSGNPIYEDAITVNNIIQNEDIGKFTCEIEINESGKYVVEARKSGEQNFISSNIINVVIVNHPVLVEGLQPVKYDNSGNLISGIETSGEDWYNYGDGRWANAIIYKETNEDISKNDVYVWIPRYAYYIDDENNINIEFMKENSSFITTANEALERNYRVMPAFKDGTNNDFANGEWDSELTGIWVAKYEAITSSNGGVAQSIPSTQPATCGNDLIPFIDTIVSYSNTYCKNIKIVKINKPNVDTHLMKNSEWGAVAYLTNSKYGNTSIQEKTGFSTEITNVLTTSTGNYYGIEGLIGGIQEVVAAGIDVTALNSSNMSNKYVTLYNSDSTENDIYGDGIKDITWVENNEYPDINNNFFARGGYKNGASLNYQYNSIFTFLSVPENKQGEHTEKYDYTGFRPVLIIEY